MSYTNTMMQKSDPKTSGLREKQPVYILFVFLLKFSEENKGSLTDSFSFAALALMLVTTHNNPATISQQKQTKRDSNCFLTENRLSYA